jgi:hypothetical protein
MFTTLGLTARAMFRNVPESIGPFSGALFMAGTLTGCADELGDSSSLDAMTIPTAAEAMAMRMA